jgi:hypothetical protein
MLNESFVKRTILNLDNIVERSLTKARRKEFKQRVTDSLKSNTKPPSKKQNPAPAAIKGFEKSRFSKSSID